ncbi:glycosyltransferase family 1 protein [Pseudaminobacter sp. 19-2017]|uniref:Glycosyltransferase family 1 protein n=1 Tax=Pseudaminobacter soli (ex Zhang et al. 2022) TaxID=2831468 RepID=A0A942E1S9_9HYPH|nr:glycosyltransferase family 1 protein [Pseudaminobacter soli]MBS3649420.1 glycosyltransferase family 1 protein [Pseudaminobacter soli]
MMRLGTPLLVLNAARVQLGRRSRQIRTILTTDGYRRIVHRLRSKASDRLRPRNEPWLVSPEDVLAADVSQPVPVARLKVKKNEPIVVNWVIGAAAPRSGGHTTAYRMVNYLQGKGYRNRVYLHDPFGGDHKYYAAIAREHYGLHCEIGDLRKGMSDAHAVVATDWASAYAVFNARCTGKRFYFVQDFEPYFYPVGTNSLLAENTYRMGFHGITAGRWLAEKLAREFGMRSDFFPFGCDTGRYRRDPSSKRGGVAFYARAGTPRRAVELGLLALELFARRQPEIELHLFGERIGNLHFNFINHGVVTPAKLNDIYNRCFAGLCLSLTNVSLVPYEMLASGCIPIVNDAEHNRMVLNNAHIRYAAATPHALAAALDEVVNMADFVSASTRAAESVASTSWDDAGAAVDAAIRRALHEGEGASDASIVSSSAAA